MPKGIELLNDVWTELEKAEDDAYTGLTRAVGLKKITPKMQFSALYNNCYLLADTKEEAETLFFMTLSGNEWLIMQINNYVKWLKELEDMDNWTSEERFTNTTTITNEMNDKTIVKNTTKGTGKVTSTNKDESGVKSKTGNADGILYEDIEYLDVETGDIPANSLSQVGTISIGTAENDTSDLTTSEGTTNSDLESKTNNKSSNFYHRQNSNAAEDYKGILSLHIDNHLRILWGKFSFMFSIYE